MTWCQACTCADPQGWWEVRAMLTLHFKCVSSGLTAIHPPVCSSSQPPAWLFHVSFLRCSWLLCLREHVLCTQSFSHVQLFGTPWTIAHQAPLSGILQANTLKWVAISSYGSSSWPRDGTRVSWIDRWVLYHRASWEALLREQKQPNATPSWLSHLIHPSICTWTQRLHLLPDELLQFHVLLEHALSVFPSKVFSSMNPLDFSSFLLMTIASLTTYLLSPLLSAFPIHWLIPFST